MASDILCCTILGGNSAGISIPSTAINPKNVIVFLVTLGFAVFGSVLFRGFLSIIPILIAVIAGYAAAIACGIVDFSAVAAAPVFALPNFSAPRFNLEAIMIILPVILVDRKSTRLNSSHWS